MRNPESFPPLKPIAVMMPGKWNGRLYSRKSAHFLKTACTTALRAPALPTERKYGKSSHSYANTLTHSEQEKQYGGNNMEPVTLSINTVRGRAFHALFAYIFWCDRHLGGKGENGSRIPQEAKDVLEYHLDPSRDPSLAVRSVYGQFFPWLFVFDPLWGKTLIERIFPADDPDRRYAAWETYLSNGVFSQVYAALKFQYELAISEARKFKPTRRYWADPIERLLIT